MTKTPEYWKAYRIKNKEKLQAYERARNTKRRSTLTVEASETPKPALTKVAVPEYQKCQSSFCQNPGSEVLVAGMKAWLCELHARRARKGLD